MQRAVKVQIDRVVKRAVWSWQGLVHVWQTEQSLKQWIIANAVFAVLAFVLPLSASERGMLLMGGILVLAAECMNTAIERAVDDIGTDKRALAGQAKDTASAAVMLTAIAVGVAWLCVMLGLIF